MFYSNSVNPTDLRVFWVCKLSQWRHGDLKAFPLPQLWFFALSLCCLSQVSLAFFWTLASCFQASLWLESAWRWGALLGLGFTVSPPLQRTQGMCLCSCTEMYDICTQRKAIAMTWKYIHNPFYFCNSMCSRVNKDVQRKGWGSSGIEVTFMPNSALKMHESLWI